MDGILNIFKEKGFTSHDVVAIVRKTINQKKVGHTGTLDPEAEGVLPVCLGKGTKLADYIMGEKKSYRAKLTLGVTTDTEDHTGTIIETCVVELTKNEILDVVNSFKGEYMQTPPMYSALKVKGKKLYELARQGEVIHREPRRVFIYDINISEFISDKEVVIEVVCSKGTYIRTLCVDIGFKLGCGGHMSSLLRTATGNFKLKDSITLGELKKLAEEENVSQVLIGIDEVLSSYNKVFIQEKGRKLLHNGCKIYDYFFSSSEKPIELDDTVLVYDDENVFIGIYKVINDIEKNRVCVKPLKMLL